MKQHNLFFLIVLGSTIACTSTRSEQETIVCEQYIHKYGVEVECDDWKSRGKDGTVVSTLANGVTMSQSYNAGVLDGETTYTYPHSDIIQKVQSYNQGTIQREMENNSFGAPHREIVYHTPENYTLKIWYENGTPQSIEEYTQGKLIEGSYYSIQNQLEARVQKGDGTRIERDPTGLLVSSASVSRGEVASKKSYYPNGAPEWDETYVKGRLEGERKHYLPTGEPDYVETWKGNKKNGITFTFIHGERFSEIPFVDGVKEGIEKKYRQGNLLVEEITWKGNQKHGPSTSYVGGVKRVEWYFQDKLVSEAMFEEMSISSQPNLH